MSILLLQLPALSVQQNGKRLESSAERRSTTYYGIIASGNAVIKHGATREKIRKETGALCFEMEAAV